MIPVDDATSKEAIEMLEKMTSPERAYALYQLIRKKLEGESPGVKIPVESPDGTIFGYIQSSEPPSPEEITVMRERARRTTPGAGRPVRVLLDRMEAGDENGVKRFIID
jgi:hypothetical protein